MADNYARANFNPILEAIGTGKSRADSAQSQANVNFDERIMREALPITRIVGNDGSINRDIIRGAGKGFTDPSKLFEELSDSMPRGRGVDPMVFQQKFEAGKAMYDMNLAKQIAMMGQSGYSEKQIWNEFGNNEELRRYAVENSLLTPRTKSKALGFVGSTALGAGAYGAIKGTELLATTPKPSSATLKELRKQGWDFKGGKLRRMGEKDFIKYQSQDWDEPKDTRPKKADGSVDKRHKWGQKQKVQSPEWKAQAKQALEARNKAETSRTAKAALGAKNKAVRKAATNIVVKNAAKHVGAKVGTGMLARAAGFAAGVTPWGLAANVALMALPSIWNLVAKKQASAADSTGPRWK